MKITIFGPINLILEKKIKSLLIPTLKLPGDKQMALDLYFLGQKVSFEKGMGPLLQKIDFNKVFLQRQINFKELTPLKNAISQIKKTTWF